MKEQQLQALQRTFLIWLAGLLVITCLAFTAYFMGMLPWLWIKVYVVIAFAVAVVLTLKYQRSKGALTGRPARR